MRTKITYIANDDTEFENERECLEWEYKISHLPKAIIFYDKNGNPLDIEGSAEFLENEYYEAYYIEVSNIKSMKEDLSFCHSYWGWCLPEKSGLFKWNDDGMDWAETNWKSEGIK